MTASDFIRKKDIENGSCSWAETDYDLAIALDEYAALKIAEALKPAHNISVMKLPDFETVNDARLSSKDSMLENVTKRQLRAVYDIISKQLSQR